MWSELPTYQWNMKERRIIHPSGWLAELWTPELVELINVTLQNICHVNSDRGSKKFYNVLSIRRVCRFEIIHPCKRFKLESDVRISKFLERSKEPIILPASLMMAPIWLTSCPDMNQEDYDINTNLRHHNAKESKKASILDTRTNVIRVRLGNPSETSSRRYSWLRANLLNNRIFFINSSQLPGVP